MRTTLDLPDPIFRRLKARAAERGLKLKELLAEYVEAGLEGRPAHPTSAHRTRLPPPVVFKADQTGPIPRVHTNAELFAILESEDLAEQRRAPHEPEG